MDIGQPERILIVKLSALGDVVQALAFAEAIHALWPRASLDWLVEEAAGDLLAGHPVLDRVIVSRRKTWLGRGGGGVGRRLTDIRRFLEELRSRPYDLVVDLQGLFKSGILTRLARSRVRLGFERSREFAWLFVNQRLPAYDPDRHAVERYLDVARFLGSDVKDPVFRLGLGPAEAARVDELLADMGGREGPLVVVHPEALWPTKRWSSPKFAAVCDGLVRERDARVVLTGAPADVDLAEEIIGRTVTPPANLVGQTGLRQLAELLRRAAVVISPDTGTMHLAAAVGAPVVALFGPTAPWRTGPVGRGHRVIRVDLDCSPCFKKSCPDPVCLERITPEMVLTEAGGVLARTEALPDVD
ncbi:MAG: lipopolysaccharide heptosyltransferase II [Proteobacteria bacterium]|nr:lipopolysaccharide heptosyltransferase II [Pseudomonadota bacterium]MBU1739992.1 lipopolysaccharide heptosyltransferase II [Pseudomonadota bacterium]